MKHVLLVLAVLLGAYLLAFTIDVMTMPATSPKESALAETYLESQELPTPTLAFYEDGCTAWPDFILWHDFYEACLRHDIAYWAGGEEWRKAAADAAFRNDLSETGPLGPLFATIMYSGVHHFGNNVVSRLLGSEWGYGWSE